MKNWKDIAFLLLTSMALSAENKPVFYASVDQYYSPYMGSDAILTIHQSLDLSEQWLTSYEEPKRGLKPSFYRWVDLTLIWTPITVIEQVVQHELFGHGYRIRSLKEAEVKDYHIKTPPPYGTGGGATEFVIGDKLKVGELQAINIAGLEAEDLLSRQIKISFLQKNALDAKLGLLFSNTKFSSFYYSLIDYSLDGELEDHLFSGNDIEAFIYTNDLLYPQSQIKKGNLTLKLLANLLDPVVWYNQYNTFQFIFTGKNCSCPMIPFGKDLKWLPGIQVSLAPYGVDYVLENFFIFHDKPLYAYAKSTFDKANEAVAFGFEAKELYTKDPVSFGVKTHLWRQPDFLANCTVGQLLSGVKPPAFEKQSVQKHYGAYLGIIGNYHMSRNFNNFYLECGAKSSGYIPGYPLQASVVWRVGAQLSF